MSDLGPEAFEELKSEVARTASVAESVARSIAAANRVSEYLEIQNRSQTAFTDLSWTQRLAVTDTFTLISHAVVLVSFVIWWFLLPQLSVLHLGLLVTPAYAQSGPSGAFDPRPWIYFGIFLALLVTFLVSVLVSFFGKSPKAAEHASTISKTLLGFFIGATTKFLGM